MTNDLKADCLILGGGIAGLWCLDALIRAGHNAVLFSKGPLAAGQTMASQGIIHGGTKYTLEAHIGLAAKNISAMPVRWRKALSGDGETDLSGAKIAAANHLIWIPPQLGAGLMGFFTSKAMRGRTEQLPSSKYPGVFLNPAFKGSVLALDEVVLDVPSLVSVLAGRHSTRIFDSADFGPFDWCVENGSIRASIQTNGDIYALGARNIVLTAGAGNATLAHECKQPQWQSQLRPLRMVMLRHAPGDLWAHCVVKQRNPRFTITTHQAADGARIWYIGGDIAERGATLSAQETIDLARQELLSLLPWLNFSKCQWATLLIDRAEARHTGGSRPDSPMLISNGSVHMAWPTKLAFAPLLADQVVAAMGKSECLALDHNFADLPKPEISKAPWDEVNAWN